MQRILAHFHPFSSLRRAFGVFFLKVFYENLIARKRYSGQTEKLKCRHWNLLVMLHAFKCKAFRAIKAVVPD